MEDLCVVLRRRRIPGLDGLRALSAIAVVVYHFAPTSGVPAGIGVTCFFVLSGFLITWLLRREWNETGGVNFRSFYVRRTLRIFPAYYVFLGVMGLLMLIAHRRWAPGQGWAALLYLSDYYGALFPGGSGSIGHTWSLAVEEQFYLIWPLAFTFLAARGTRAMLIGLSSAAVAVLIWRSVLLFGLGASTGYAYHAFDTRADSLALGCLLAIVLETQSGRRWGSGLSKRWWAPLLTMLALAVRPHVTGSALLQSAIGPTIDSLLCALLIVQFMLLTTTSWWRWLEHPVVLYIGAVSYPLYLYHGIPEFAVRRLHVPPAVQLSMAVLGAICLASLSYHVVERPCLKLRQRFIRHVPEAAAAAAITNIHRSPARP